MSDAGVSQVDLAGALSLIHEVDIVGVAAVADTKGTPLHDSAMALLPGAQSIVVFGMEIFSELADLVTPEKIVGEAAARDLLAPHYDYLSGRMNRGLYQLAKEVRGAGYHAIPLPSQGTPVDARYQRGLLSFKHAGEYAGLGRIGLNSLLITPEYGPRVRLACLLTDAPLPAGSRMDSNPCDGCGACVKDCPSGALSMPEADIPYAINKYACASFRGGAGSCLNCMNACPVGR